MSESNRSGGDGGGGGGGGERYAYPQLTGVNYMSWSIRVQAIMEDQGVWEVVEPSEEADAAAEDQAAAVAKTAKDRKARAHLLQCLPDDLLMQVAKKKTGKEDDEGVDQYASKILAMSVKYGNLGGTLDDTAMVKKLFDTVPDRFITVVAGIEQFFDLKKLPFEEAVGRLKAYEERIQRGAGGSRGDGGQLLLTQAEWEARHKKSGGESSGKGRAQYGGSGDEKKGDEAHHARVENIEPVLMLAVTEVPESLEFTPRVITGMQHSAMYLDERQVMPELHLTGGEKKTGNVWYLDNGASNHMSGDAGKFQDLDKGVVGKVRFGDGSAVEIKGRGTLLF
ncbi:uncharacterized protein [Miscanthus floridulus]|uniref:uncharacterized protein n=1 Tax=Miscanthus floridulus TaxID=154761 RepID=UPI00345AACEB